MKTSTPFLKSFPTLISSCLLTTCFVLIAEICSAQSLVKNINIDNAGSNPDIYFANDSMVIFSAFTSALGEELYHYDITNQTTQQLSDFSGESDFVVRAANVSGDRLFYYVVSNDTVSLRTLDLTSLEQNIIYQRSTNGSYPNNFLSPVVNIGEDSYLFLAEESSNYAFVKVSPAGLASTLMNIQAYPAPKNLIAFQDKLIFTYVHANTDSQVVAAYSNGQIDTLLEFEPEAFVSEAYNGFIIFNDLVYFRAFRFDDGNEIYTTDGTASGTTLIDELNPGTGSSIQSDFVSFDNWLHFSGNDSTALEELWRTDGTVFEQITDIGQGENYGAVRSLVIHENALHFLATHDSLGPQIWRIKAGEPYELLTSIVHDSTYPFYPISTIFSSGSSLYFSHPGLGMGVELHRLDETSGSGASVLRDIFPGEGSSKPTDYHSVGENIVFTALEPSKGEEIWISDGTANQTKLFIEVNIEENGSSPYLYYPLSDTSLIFWARTGLTGHEPHFSDGTATGTFLIQDLYAGPEQSFPVSVQNETNQFYFSSNSRPEDFHKSVYCIDKESRSLRPLTTKVVQDYFDIHQGQLYYSGRPDEQAFDSEFYRWDYLENRGILVKDLNNTNSSNPYFPQVSLGDKFFVSSRTSRVMWVSDGTAEGTNTIFSSNSFREGPVHNGKFYFTQGRYLRRTDGENIESINLGSSSSLVRRITVMTLINDQVYFIAEYSDSSELWVVNADGSASALGDFPGSPLNYHPIAELNDQIFFFNYIEGMVQLWKIPLDGSSDGQMIKNEVRGGSIAVTGKVILFTASDIEHGDELWLADGTIEGTRLVKDLYPGPRSSDPEHFIVVGSNVYFSATTEDIGRELWKMPIDHCLLQPDIRIIDLALVDKNETISAHQKIIGSSLISLNSDITFSAGMYVDLESGFEVELGSLFEVEKRVCE